MLQYNFLAILYLFTNINNLVVSQNNVKLLEIDKSTFQINNSSVDFRFDKVVMCHECIEVFIDYMIMKHINQVVIYSCGLNNDLRKFNLLLTKSGISSAFLKEVDKNKMKRLFPEREMKGIYVDYDCMQSKALFDMASKLTLFDDIRLWTVFTSDPAATIEELRTTNLNLDTNLVMMVKGREDLWMAYDVFNIDYSKEAPLNITFFGVYRKIEHTNTSLSTKINFPTPLLFKFNTNYSTNEINAKFQDLELESIVYSEVGHHFVNNWCVYLKESWIRRRWVMGREVTLKGAYCTVDKPKKGTYKSYIYSKHDVHRDTFTRMYIAMMDYMTDMMQFKLKLVHTTTWGAYINGSWTGVLGALTKGHADLSLSPMALKKERVGAGDVNAYACMARFPVIFRQPQSSTASLALFVYPLETRCWLVFLPISMVAVLFTMVIMIMETKFLGPNSENTDVTISNFVISIVCVLYQDGPERNPKLWSGRALLFIMLMFGYMITQFYSASLIGSILMEPPKQINNVHDLVNSKLHFRAEAVSYQWMFFKEYMAFEEVNLLYNKKLMKPGKWPTYINADDGLLLTRQGGFAFQTNAAYAYKEMKDWGDNIICEVHELYVYPLTRLYARVSRGSPYRQHITTAMLLQYERGVQSYLLERWFVKRPRCPPEHGSRPRPVGDQFYPALELLAAICVLSFLILIMEVFVARITQRRKLYPYTN